MEGPRRLGVGEDNIDWREMHTHRSPYKLALPYQPNLVSSAHSELGMNHEARRTKTTREVWIGYPNNSSIRRILELALVYLAHKETA